MKKLMLVLLGVMLISSVAFADIITFTYNTSGQFTNGNSSYNGLTFTGVPTTTQAINGSGTLTLGTLALDQDYSKSYNTYDFNLALNFIAPPITDPTLHGDVSGNVTGHWLFIWPYGTGSATVDFVNDSVNPLSFISTAGNFSLYISPNPITIDDYGTANVTAHVDIQDSTPPPPPPAVPEPASLMLMGSGLVAIASRLRRRKS